MIGIQEINSKKEYKEFYRVTDRVYKNDPNYRSTEDEIIKMLVERKSVFFKHSKIINYLIMVQKEIVGRFSLIHDTKLQDYVQVAFFESIDGLSGVWESIKKEAKKQFKQCSKIIVGFNGHLNYGVGFLASNFDETPLFGLPYTKRYYLSYFSSLKKHHMVSYRIKNRYFYIANVFDFLKKKNPEISIRTMDKNNIEKETEIYTNLNNECFRDHPFWSDRDVAEDLELFNKFKILLKNENLLIAEHDNKPVAFLLWYPDFNQLTDNSLGIVELIKYKFTKKIDTVRLTEIAVLPEYRRKGIMQSLLKESANYIKKGGYKYCEGGFIFESNDPSILFAKNMIQKGLNLVIKPYRRYVIFEGEI